MVSSASPPFSISPRRLALALNTSFEHEASYCFTPNGAILLRGFQSPIPQSGLAAAVLQRQTLAQAASFSAVGEDPSRTLLTQIDGAVDSNSVAGGVVTPMKERVVLLGRLGEGATGVVYRAFDLLDLRLVAVKVIPVNDQNKRRQIVHELLSLRDGLMARPLRAGESTPSSHCSHHSSEAASSRESSHCLWPSKNVKMTPTSAGSEHVLELMDVFVTTSTSTVSLVVEYMDGGSLQVRRGTIGRIDMLTCNVSTFLSWQQHFSTLVALCVHRWHWSTMDECPTRKTTFVNFVQYTPLTYGEHRSNHFPRTIQQNVKAGIPNC